MINNCPILGLENDGGPTAHCLICLPGWLNEHQWAQLRGLEALPVFKTGSHSLCNTLEQVPGNNSTWWIIPLSK